MKKKDYDVQFMREHYKRIHILLNHEKDKDIIEHLQTKDSVNHYIKNLIRNDIKSQN
jgi:hypothetical protein